MKHKEPIIGALHRPYRETGMRGFEPLPVVGFLYIKFMEIIFGKIFSALGTLLLMYILFYVWRTSKEHTQKHGDFSTLWKGLGICLALAFFMTSVLGNPSCLGGDQDQFGSHCSEYADDGFVPSTEERVAVFLYYLILFYIPVLVGIYSADEEYIKARRKLEETMDLLRNNHGNE